MGDSQGDRRLNGWHVATFALTAVSVVLVAIVLVLLVGYTDAYYKDKEAEASASPSPTVESEVGDVDPSPVPDQGEPDLADKVAVAFSNATGWPHQETGYDYVFGFTSVDDDLLVKTNLDAAADLSDLCNTLFQLGADPVLEVGPIDQVLVLGTSGQVIWSCVEG